MLLDLERWADQQFSSQWARWPGIYVISGFRTRPVAPWTDPSQPPAEESRHLSCPALAVDIRVGNAPASTTPPEVFSALGTAWKAMGGRWGGDFSPPDWNHYDIDPALAGLGV